VAVRLKRASPVGHHQIALPHRPDHLLGSVLEPLQARAEDHSLLPVALRLVIKLHAGLFDAGGTAHRPRENAVDRGDGLKQRRINLCDDRRDPCDRLGSESRMLASRFRVGLTCVPRGGITSTTGKSHRVQGTDEHASRQPPMSAPSHPRRDQLAMPSVELERNNTHNRILQLTQLHDS